MFSTDPRRPLRLATVGDNCIDVLRYAVDGRTSRWVGGNAVNVAVQAARLGAEAHYFGAVGPDADGDHTRRVLEAQGVGTAGLVVRPGLTSITEIEVRADGERILTYENFGVCRGYAPPPVHLDSILTADHVHTGWLNDGGELRRALAGRGRSVSQDLSVNAAPEDLGIDGLSIAFGSLTGPPGPAETLGRQWLAQGARMAVVTRGPYGATVVMPEGACHIPAESVEPLDTTGAGDSFIAGFLVAHLRGAAPQDAAREGAWAARITCLHEGGFPQETPIG